MSAEPRVVIVGAGPAGIRAAETIVGAGIRPIVIDENPTWGGQIYRQPPANAGFQRTKKGLYGFEAAKADSVHAAMAALLPRVDYRAETLVWACEPGHVETLSGGRPGRVAFSHLIIASGATDRVLPLPGWTLPGVYTLGAAQIALKAQGCAIGSNVVLAGTGPLLYLVAYQYCKAGANVVAVLDTSPFVRQAMALPKLSRQPATLAKGIYYLSWLKAKGVRIEFNVSLISFEGERAISGVRWQRNKDAAASTSAQWIDCDSVGVSFGLRPETQLADLAGCRFRYDTLNRCWLPERDLAGRSSVTGVYLAGDGAGIAGADAAELAGRRAGLALLSDLGIAHSRGDGTSDDVDTLERKLKRIAVFRSGIETAFAPPRNPARAWPDNLTICRCEEIAAGTLRHCIRSGQATEINRLKALTRVGMGRCQGRMCGEAAIALLAEELGKAPEAVGRLRSQSPIKPIPITPELNVDTLETIPEGDRDE
jgi:NADPH-dependent 2,4-dienoyl-CoA reductase/sulfur reductase-like enzyme